MVNDSRSPAARKPVTILHVDDDEANRYAISRSLRKAGFDVTEAGTGREALEKAAARPDLVILDVHLPDISGFEVCRRLKADPATAATPVLHLSASFVRGEDKAHGLEAGADAYLVRPVEPVELVATVNALLRARESEEAVRASEERYRSLVEATAAIVWAATTGGDFRAEQPRWGAFTGQDFEQLRGRGWLEAVHPDDRAGTVRLWDEAVARGTPCEVEHRLRRRDGAYRHMLARAVPIRDRLGGVREWVGVHTDITDHVLARQERDGLLASERAARARAESLAAEADRANRLKDEFLATLSHELRTPLNAIVGWSQILRAGPPDPADVAEGLEVIERNAKAQAQLIEDLLDVSRIISGKLRLDVRRVELSAVVDAALASTYPAAEAKGVRLHRVLDPTGTAVLGDAGRLQQVVWNLLSNAIKFTPKGGAVRVSLARVASDVEVVVSDSGRGIPAAFLPFVFERFRQADASTRRNHGGLGLGLAIVRHLTELHGGTVQVGSDGDGKGATFTLRLPVTATRLDPGPPDWETEGHDDPPGPAPAEPMLTGVRVLVVEDEPDSRHLLRRILEARQAVVTTAGSVAEAMRWIDEAGGQVDVLVSDIGMAGEDGYDLIRRVRSLPAAAGGRVPAVALTAFARVEDRRRALLAGFQVHIPKPVDPAELVAVVASAAGRTGPNRDP